MKRRAAPIAIRIMRVLAWVVVGAVITVGVAWWSVRGWDHELARTTQLLLGGEPGSSPPNPRDVPPRSWPVNVPSDWGQPDYVDCTAHTCWTNVFLSTGPAAPLPKRWAGFTSFGWPCRALRDEWWDEVLGPGRTVSQRGPAIRSPWVQQYLGVSCLPLRLVWPGFALNTLFYAALAWGLWQLPLALRRRSRAKRGACVRCGYDLKGLPTGSACPECGPASGVRG